MSIKKKKGKQQTIRNIFSPYMAEDKQTIEEWFEEYKKDDAKLVMLDDLKFSKIIYKCEFLVHGDNILMVSIEPQESIRINDILIDEEGREFVVLSFPMIRFIGNPPEWYTSVAHMEIRGKKYEIGDYLALKKQISKGLLLKGYVKYERKKVNN